MYDVWVLLGDTQMSTEARCSSSMKSKAALLHLIRFRHSTADWHIPHQKMFLSKRPNVRYATFMQLKPEVFKREPAAFIEQVTSFSMTRSGTAVHTSLL